MEPALGRFTTVDPLAEKYYPISPYAYVANNPLKFIDPTGMAYTTTNRFEIQSFFDHLEAGGAFDEFDTNGWDEFDDEPKGLRQTRDQMHDMQQDLNMWTKFTNMIWETINTVVGLLPGGTTTLTIIKAANDVPITEDDVIDSAIDTATLPLGFIGKGAKVSTRGIAIWPKTKNASAAENAFSHWKKHGKEFPEFQNAKQYIEGTKDFLHNSPLGTLVKTRSNGDILKYNPRTNTFGVMDVNGVPRTMFKPLDGLEYWNKQY